jgi:predicted CXXCH cytochrome family protein
MSNSRSRHGRWVAAAVALAAIFVSGCGDDETTVFVEKPIFEDPPDAAQGFLGFDESEENLTTCGNCHVGQQSDWEETRHANAWQTLDESGHSQGFCENCHTTGPLGNPTDGPVGYAGTLDARYHDVQCESCHGPGLNHVTNPDASQPLASIAVAYDTLTSMGTNCAECHSGTHHPFVEDWSQSKHAVPNEEVISRSDPSSCISCHTGQGALRAWGVQAAYLESDAAPADHSGITCGVCHDPHGSPFEAQLRYSISVPDEQQNLCMKCHNRRSQPDVEAASLRGPHAPEGPLLLGTAGWWPPGFEPEIDRIVGTHGTGANPRLCATCHVNSYEVTDEVTGDFVFNATGHLFEAIPCVDGSGVPISGAECELEERAFTSCTTAGCHGSEEAARSAYITAKDRIDELVDEVDCLIEQLEMDDPDEFNTSDGVFTLAEGAWFNARLCGDFPGSPIHNPFMTEQLLTASIEAFKDEYGVTCPLSKVSLTRILQ